jgi:SAM-dependent methyltransferase
MNMEYPDSMARFYDLIYHKHRDGVDNAFFQQEIRSAKGRVLEIGVGTGRLFTDALQQGADIYGLDISHSMINVLLGKLDHEQHFRISRQNIIDFSYDFRFDLIIAPFRVMMHLFEKEEQIRAIDNVYEHLAARGRFIFDAFVPDLKQLIEGVDNWTDFEGEYEKGKKITRTVSTKPSLIDQTIDVHFHLEWEEEVGLCQDDWRVPLRFFFRFELEHLVERTKFNNYKILGDYLGNELEQNSREFLVICQK